MKLDNSHSKERTRVRRSLKHEKIVQSSPWIMRMKGKIIGIIIIMNKQDWKSLV